MSDLHRVAPTRKALATMPPALYAKYLEGTIDALHSKSEQIFRTLQERDRDVRAAAERLAYYQDIEATFHAKTQSLEEEATYHRNKWKELDAMRRQDMTGRVTLAGQAQELEKRLLSSEDIVKQLQQQLHTSQLEKAQIQSTVTHQGQQIQNLQEKTANLRREVEAAATQQHEALIAQTKLTELAEAQVTELKRQCQLDVDKICDLTHEIAQLQRANAALEARASSVQSALSEKDVAIESLVEQARALTQHLKDVQESQSRMADVSTDHANAVAQYTQQIQTLEVHVAQLGRARNQCVEWKARHCEEHQVDRLWWLQQTTWLQWQLQVQCSRRRRLETGQTQWRAKLAPVVAQVREMKLAMASMQALVAAAMSQPWNSTIAAITMATDKACTS